MRKDMSKVIVERPRLNHRYFKEQKYKGDLEEAPLKEGMRPKSHQRKQLNENLAPLWRFLESKIGKSWNKTFSEICENICIDSAVQNHIREHLEMDVYKNVFIKNKLVFSKRAYNKEYYQLNDVFYVHPFKGTLQKAPKRKYKPRDPKTYKKLNDKQWALKEDGIWYTVTLDWKADSFSYGLWEEPWFKTRYVEHKIAGGVLQSIYERLSVVSKKRLSKKLIKEFELNGL